MKAHSRFLIVSTIALFLVQCTIPVFGQFSAKKKKERPPAQPTMEKLSAAVPSLAALAESNQSQVKGGLRITIQQPAFEARESSEESTNEIAPPMFLGLVAKPAPNAIYVETTRVPKLTVTPDHLVFHLQISNQMSRVFRGAGIAVQFNVAGKVVSIDPSGYGDLVNAIVPPLGEQDIAIVGPEIASIPAPSTIGLFLYDVVTKMDEAGNITDKQNFQWYFSYQTQVVEKDVSVPAPQRGWVIPR